MVRSTLYPARLTGINDGAAKILIDGSDLYVTGANLPNPLQKYTALTDPQFVWETVSDIADLLTSTRAGLHVDSTHVYIFSSAAAPEAPWVKFAKADGTFIGNVVDPRSLGYTYNVSSSLLRFQLDSGTSWSVSRTATLPTTSVNNDDQDRNAFAINAEQTIVYHSNGVDTLYARNASNGTEIWSAAIDARYSRIVWCDSTLLLLSNSNLTEGRATAGLIVIDSSDGSQVTNREQFSRQIEVGSVGSQLGTDWTDIRYDVTSNSAYATLSRTVAIGP